MRYYSGMEKKSVVSLMSNYSLCFFCDFSGLEWFGSTTFLWLSSTEDSSEKSMFFWFRREIVEYDSERSIIQWQNVRSAAELCFFIVCRWEHDYTKYMFSMIQHTMTQSKLNWEKMSKSSLICIQLKNNIRLVVGTSWSSNNFSKSEYFFIA